MQSELKVRELERFKACYCGLCHALGKKYGSPARFILNYEFVLLTMLLWGEDEQPVIKRTRCIMSPVRKKRFCARNSALDACAGYSVILTWWKLRDNIIDDPGFRTIPTRLLMLVLHRAYKKASREYPEFDGRVRDEMASLAEYESENASSIDGAADKFAKILSATAPLSASDDKLRPMRELLYHLGRWVYILDACDDYNKDAKAGRYNPVAARYASDDGNMAVDRVAGLETTLTHSNNLVCLAFELLPENVWADVVRNMIYLGMPEVLKRVMKTIRTGID